MFPQRAASPTCYSAIDSGRMVEHHMILGIDASNIRAGGGVTHLRELLSAAEPASHGVDRVVLWAGSRTAEQMPHRSWLTTVHIPILDRSLPYRSAWQHIALAGIANQACDVLLIPGGTYLGAFRPFISISQNMLPFAPPERRRYGFSAMRLKLELLALSQSATFQRSDGVIFLTATAREQVEAQIGCRFRRSTVIPHGISRAFDRPPLQQKPLASYTATRPFRWLYVSIVDMYKHQWQLVKAVASLRREGYPVCLDLIGPAYEPALRLLRDAIEGVENSGEFIHYHGPMQHSILARMYHEADGFVFASSCENMPNILLEAMASGLPIACSMQGPMPEVLGDGGEYFDPEDPVSAACALRKLLCAPEMRANKAKLAYERSQQYSWERCAHETFAFVSDVARGRAGTIEAC